MTDTKKKAVPVEIPGWVWSSLELAHSTIKVLVDPDHGVLTALHKQGVSQMYEATCAVRDTLDETIIGATGSGAWDSPVAEAMVEFLDASIAVWREIDRLDSRSEGYHPTDMDVALRHRERKAWERYRDLRDAASSPYS